MEVLFSCLRIGVAVYVGLCLLVVFRQSRYVYYPGSAVTLTPADIQLGFESVLLQTDDNEQVAAWFVPVSEDWRNAPTLLFCHGNAGNMSDRLGSIQTFHRLGLNVFIFDYRGYGESSGRPTEAGTCLDARAAWDYLRREQSIPAERIVVFGRSLGGVVATWLAGQVTPGALVAESSFTSARDMAATMFPLLPSRLLCRFRYDTLAMIRTVTCPVLLAHSRDDEMIPFTHAQRLFDAAGEPKRLVEMGGGHNAGGLDADGIYQGELKEFLDLYLGQEHG